VLGLAAGGVLAALVVLTKFSLLVNTPRPWHPWLLLLLFAIPALAGSLIGVFWPRLVSARQDGN
jgi:hypothetical protein